MIYYFFPTVSNAAFLYYEGKVKLELHKLEENKPTRFDLPIVNNKGESLIANLEVVVTLSEAVGDAQSEVDSDDFASETSSVYHGESMSGVPSSSNFLSRDDATDNESLAYLLINLKIIVCREPLIDPYY
jgi:hypothetical protein